MTTDINIEDPKFLAFWTKAIRESLHLSQEALADSSGLSVRTIQRIEAGNPANLATRRSLARGLGYDNSKIFEDPKFNEEVQTLFREINKIKDDERKKKFPKQIYVRVSQVLGGVGLLRIASEGNSYLFHTDDSIIGETKKIAASIFDYLHDIGDVVNEISFADKLSHQDFLNDLCEQLKERGATCYSGFRATEMIGANWTVKKNMPLTISYLIVVPTENVLTEIMVPRRLS